MRHLISVLLLVLSTPLWAALQFPGGSSAPSAKGFFGAIALKGGMGQAGSDADAVESRDLYRYGADLTLGLRWGSLLMGAAAEYNFWRQSTKPSKVDDTNLSGRQLNLAPVIGIGLGPFMFQTKAHLMSTVTLDQKTRAGEKLVYTAPAFPAFSAQLNYRLGGKSFVGVEYTKVTYEEKELDGESSSLSSDDEVTYSGWGVVYGLMF